MDKEKEMCKGRKNLPKKEVRRLLCRLHGEEITQNGVTV